MLLSYNQSHIISCLDLVLPPFPAIIVSRCLVSYQTPLINSLLQHLSLLFASKSSFQHQGPLNIPELALYLMACQLTTTSMAQWPLCQPQPSSKLSTTPSWGYPSQKTCQAQDRAPRRPFQVLAMQRGFDSLLKGTCDWAGTSERSSG